MNWMYLNPFWSRNREMVSDLDPDECRTHLRKAPTSMLAIARAWFGLGDANFYVVGAGRAGSLFELHVRVDVAPQEGSGSRMTLRFSGGFGSAVLLSLVYFGGAAAFIWALLRLAGGSAWNPIYGAALLAILVPVLLVLALRAEAPGDEDQLWRFVAEQVGGRPQPN